MKAIDKATPALRPLILLLALFLHLASLARAQYNYVPYGSPVATFISTKDTVHDTTNVPPAAPTVTITTPDTVNWGSYWMLEGTVTWGDGDPVEVFALAKLIAPLTSYKLSCYIRADWDGQYFVFEDTEGANVQFLSELTYDVLFVAYAIDGNQLFGTDSITIHFIGP